MGIRLVYSFFFLQRFAFRAYNACNDFLARSQTLYLYCDVSQEPITRGFDFSFCQNLVTHKQEKQMAHTHDLIEAKISTRTRKERQRKMIRSLVLETFFGVSLFFVFQ